MATNLKNLNTIQGEIPNGKYWKFAIVVSAWNEAITGALLSGALEALNKAEVPLEQISIKTVPGTFELALGAQREALKEDIDAVICLGCVIQGETRHFDFICDATANGIIQVGLKYNKPVIFGVLTTENEQQALERAGGKHGNKGFEAGITALQMLG
jgi:6,7-dimethyl-8-ribityllumazine synthase